MCRESVRGREKGKAVLSVTVDLLFVSLNLNIYCSSVEAAAAAAVLVNVIVRENLGHVFNGTKMKRS